MYYRGSLFAGFFLASLATASNAQCVSSSEVRVLDLSFSKCVGVAASAVQVTGRRDNENEYIAYTEFYLDAGTELDLQCGYTGGYSPALNRNNSSGITRDNANTAYVMGSYAVHETIAQGDNITLNRLFTACLPMVNNLSDWIVSRN